MRLLRFNWTKAKAAANTEKRPVIICGVEPRAAEPMLPDELRIAA